MQLHILGAGAIGCQIATALHAEHHNVTLILRSEQTLKEFHHCGSKITYRRIDQEAIELSGFNAITASNPDNPDNSNSLNSPLKTVIVTTKSQQTLEAVKSIKASLLPSSTLILLQNGIGVAEELLNTLWSGDERKYSPSFIIGVNRHSVWRRKPFFVQHNSGWTSPDEGIFLGTMPGSNSEQTQFALKALIEAPGLNATAVEWKELRIRMLRKLVVNASISSVATLVGCKNGLLLDNPHGLRLIRGVCDEAAQVLTELNITGEDLYNSIYQSIIVYGFHTCSMLQDLMANRTTEVDYINGQICHLATEQHIDAPINRLLLDLIRAKEAYLCMQKGS